jgi:hypothetical protein
MSLPATVIKTVLYDAVRWLFRVVRSEVKPKPPQAVPMTHKAVRHQQDQIRSATTGVNRMPPPRKKR